MRKPNQRIIGREEREEFWLKNPDNMFNKIIEEDFINLKKEMLIKGPEDYRNQIECTRKRHPYIT